MHPSDDFDIQSIGIDGTFYVTAARADLFCQSRINVFIQAVQASLYDCSITDFSIDMAEFNDQLNLLKSKKVLFVMSDADQRFAWRLLGRE